jgi:D-tyrosyl-tRNA(Tyr) deacylase
VQGEVVSQIGKGLCVLIGMTHDDSSDDLEYITRKLLSVRLFEAPDSGKAWAKGLKDLNLEILCVSQFTLYAKLKGNKPDYHLAMAAAEAEPMYERLMAKLKDGGLPKENIKGGVFGADMKVALVNDGPVTIIFDSNAREPGR